MGASLVAQALARWSHLTHQAFRALIAMALTAKDNSSRDVAAGLYFGGHDGLVHALLYTDGTSYDSKLRAVRLAVKELEIAGATVCVEDAYSGGRAVYKLTLDTIPMPVPKRKKKPRSFDGQAEYPAPPQIGSSGGAGNSASGGAGNSASGGAGNSASGGAGNSAIKEPLEEPLKERYEEEEVDLRADLTLVRDPAAANNPKDSSPNCSNPECILGYEIDKTKRDKRHTKRCSECNPQPEQSNSIAPPETVTVGARCAEHGLKGGTRPDGQPHCPICRHLNGKAA